MFLHSIRLLFESQISQEPTKDKDAGQFVCTAKNESGKLTATFTVKFEGNCCRLAIFPYKNISRNLESEVTSS